jgi:carboxylesterase type B
MSGAILPQYSFTNDQISIARRQTGLVGCPSSGIVEDLLECLRQVNVDDFAKPLHSMFDFGKDNPAFIWNAVIEPDFGQDRFLTENPHTLLAKGAYEKVPVLTGITKDELAFSAVAIIKNNDMLKRFDEEFSVVAPICFMYERETNRSKEISSTLKDAYKLKTPLSKSSLANINEVGRGRGVQPILKLIKILF